jgi:acetylglutamate kinase
MPQVVMTVTTACTVEDFKSRSPVEGTIPLLASIAPNLARELVVTNIEQFLKYRSRAFSANSLVYFSLL